MACMCNVQLRIVSGHDLPKIDLFSQIDPYIVLSVEGETLGRTAFHKDNPNPVWQEDFFFEAEEDEDGLHGTVVLDLYDQEAGRDEHVGSSILDLQILCAGALEEPIQLPVVFKSDKRGQKFARSAPKARLTVELVGYGKAFSSYVAELADSEEACVDEQAGVFLVPIPDAEGGGSGGGGASGAVWAGMRFSPRATQLLLVSTADPKSSSNPALSYDFSYSGVASLRLERVVYRKPVRLCGLKVWNEVRVTNVPVNANLRKVRILERERRLVDTLDPADVLVEHNYMIGMPYLAAVKELSKHAAQIDTTAQSIWLKMDTSQPTPAQLLQLDYSPAALAVAAPSTDANSLVAVQGAATSPKRQDANLPVLRIFSTDSPLNKGYELAFFGGGGRGGGGGGAPMVTVSEVFRKPVPVLGGLYNVVHMLELRDAFRGETLDEVGLGCYEMLAPRTLRLGKLLAAAVPGQLDEINEAAAYGGAGGKASYGDGGGVLGAVSGGVLRGWLGRLLPCLAPPREDAYRRQGSGGGGKVRGPNKSEEEATGGKGGGKGGERPRKSNTRARRDGGEGTASTSRGKKAPVEDSNRTTESATARRRGTHSKGEISSGGGSSSPDRGSTKVGGVPAGGGGVGASSTCAAPGIRSPASVASSSERSTSVSNYGGGKGSSGGGGGKASLYANGTSRVQSGGGGLRPVKESLKSAGEGEDGGGGGGKSRVSRRRTGGLSYQDD